MKENFPYKFYNYGSENSLDKDVLISIPASDMPVKQEDRKKFLKSLELEYDFSDWNTNLIVVENGIIVDTIYPKSWIDSLNNSLYTTYKLHEQQFEKPVTHLVKRNILLSIYKTVITVLSLLTRTQYREIIKPTIGPTHDFYKKIEIFSKIDFSAISTFNQKNISDIDCWKTIAFYIGQNILLVTICKQIYTKNSLLKEIPYLDNFINRKKLNKNDILNLNNLKNFYFECILSKRNFVTDGLYLSCENETINMWSETF